MGFTQGSQRGKDAIVFFQEGAKARRFTKSILLFAPLSFLDFPLWGIKGAWGCLPAGRQGGEANKYPFSQIHSHLIELNLFPH